MTLHAPLRPLSGSRPPSRGPGGRLAGPATLALVAITLVAGPSPLRAQDAARTAGQATPAPAVLLPSQGLVAPAPRLSPAATAGPTDGPGVVGVTEASQASAPGEGVESMLLRTNADRFDASPTSGQEQEQEMEDMNKSHEVLYALGWIAATVVFMLFWID